MKRLEKKVKVGILGCGAIGSGIAKSIAQKELKGLCELTGLYDCDQKKAIALAQTFSQSKLVKSSINELLKSCHLMVEAVNAKNTRSLIRQALSAKRDVLAMSVGSLLNAKDLFSLAAQNGCSLLIPSGAIAGIDAIKSASLAKISKITLTTRKPISGFLNVPFIQRSEINLSKITKETVLFEGGVDKAVKAFPQNINVAATLALASRAKNKILIRILTAPEYKTNSHEIEVVGNFGRILTRTENVISPENPKTSYLAILSGMQILKTFCSEVRVGT